MTHLSLGWLSVLELGFVLAILGYFRKTRRELWEIALWALLCFALGWISSAAQLPFWGRWLLLGAACAAGAGRIYWGHWYANAALGLGLYAGALVSQGILTVSLFLCLPLGDALRRDSTLVLLLRSCTRLLAILAVWSVEQLPKVNGAPWLKRGWMLIFPALSLGLLGLLLRSVLIGTAMLGTALLLTVLLVLANLIVYYLLDNLVGGLEEEKHNLLLTQQTQIQSDSVQALEKSYRDQRKLTHEYRNQVQTIYTLLQAGETDQAREFVETLQGIRPPQILAVNSKHPIIDAVINYKYQTARDKDIDMQLEINNLSKVTLATTSLVVLLSNLLDNAIEACCRLEENREIQCTVLAQDALFLSIRNTSPPVTIQGNQIPTSKIPARSHGYGLPQILSILEQLHAEYNFSYQNGWFTFVAEIPLV